MTKRILITSTDSMMKQFLEPHVINLHEQGYDVEIACSEVLDRFDEVQEDLGHLVKIHKLSLKRSPLALGAHIKGYRELKNIIDHRNYDLVWTNEPVMGVITRLAARHASKTGTTVLYMVHGFHFFKGAPLINWMIYYPIERIMAHFTDVLCTINKEDFARAQKMRADKVTYIHGVGINTSRLHAKSLQTNIRHELGLKDDSFIVLSVGELNKNKNQKVIIQALSQLKDPDIHYVLCGKGNQKENLEKLVRELNLEHNVHFLGYRQDVVDICSQSDVFAMPSKREGLPVASLEAMYCGLPLVNSNIRGLADVTENEKSGYVCRPNDINAFAEGIKSIKGNPQRRMFMGKNNKQKVIPFCLENTKKEIETLIRNYI